MKTAGDSAALIQTNGEDYQAADKHKLTQLEVMRVYYFCNLLFFTKKYAFGILLKNGLEH